MKHILLTLAATLTVFTACGQNKKEMKTLVAYFSATGITEAVAKDLAAAYPKINWKAGVLFHAGLRFKPSGPSICLCRTAGRSGR